MKEEQLPNQVLGLSNTFYVILLVLRYLFGGLLVFAGLGVVSLNSDAVVLNYFWGSLSLPLYLLLLGTFTLGWLTGTGLSLVTQVKLNIINRRWEQRCLDVENELIRLKEDFAPDEAPSHLSHAFPAVPYKETETF